MREPPLFFRLFLFAVLAAVLSAPLAVTVARGRLFEKGSPPTIPSLSRGDFFEGLKAYLRTFDASLTKNFQLQDDIVTYHNLIWNKYLHAPSVSVVVGKGNWLYYVGNHTLSDYEGRTPFTQAQLDAWVDALIARKRWLASQGVKELLVITPNKLTICPGHLPDLLRERHRPGRLDQLVQ